MDIVKEFKDIVDDITKYYEYKEQKYKNVIQELKLEKEKDAQEINNLKLKLQLMVSVINSCTELANLYSTQLVKVKQYFNNRDTKE